MINWDKFFNTIADQQSDRGDGLTNDEFDDILSQCDDPEYDVPYIEPKEIEKDVL